MVLRNYLKTVVTILCFAVLISTAVFGQTPVYRDASQPIAKRVDDLLSRMTLKEKVGQMNIPTCYSMDIGFGLGSKVSPLWDDPSKENRKIIYTGFPDPTDLEALPLPARHLISRVYSVADIIVNRGCPNQCSFCSRTKLFPKMRIRSVGQVMQEVDYILSGSNYHFINFYENININHKYFNHFLDEK